MSTPITADSTAKERYTAAVAVSDTWTKRFWTARNKGASRPELMRLNQKVLNANKARRDALTAMVEEESTERQRQYALRYREPGTPPSPYSFPLHAE